MQLPLLAFIFFFLCSFFFSFILIRDGL